MSAKFAVPTHRSTQSYNEAKTALNRKFKTNWQIIDIMAAARNSIGSTNWSDGSNTNRHLSQYRHGGLVVKASAS